MLMLFFLKYSYVYSEIFVQVDSVAYSANMANLVNSVGLNLIDAYDRLVRFAN